MRFFAVGFASLFVGCATAQSDVTFAKGPEGATPAAGELCSGAPVQHPKPDWVGKLGGGARTYYTEGRVVFGVAAVSGLDNCALAVTMSEQRARGELARASDIISNRVIGRYWEDTERFGALQEETSLGCLIKGSSELMSRDAKVVDRWQDLESGTRYALVSVDLDTYLQGIRDVANFAEPYRSCFDTAFHREHLVPALTAGIDAAIAESAAEPN